MNRAALFSCLLLSCSAPLTTADSGTGGGGGGGSAVGGGQATGGGSAQGGGTGGGNASDGGLPEPTFGSSVLFKDDFNGYPNEVALRATYPEIREQGGLIALDRTVSDGGALRLDYTTSASCDFADVHVGKLLAGDVAAVLVTWKFLSPAGFTACDGGVEDFTLARTANRTSIERGATWVVHTAGETFAQTQRLATHAPPQLAADQWHRVTLFFSRQLTPSSNDGEVRLWVDGALVIDAVGATGTQPFTLATWPGGVSNQLTQSRWVDDIAITTP